jgi:PhnB protein
MKSNPHLAFNAECEVAFRFYEQCLGGKIITMLKWRDSPMAGQAPPGWGDKILHATLVAGGAVLMGSDSMPGQYEKPKGFSVMLDVDDPSGAERIFHALGKTGVFRCRSSRHSGRFALAS